MRGTLVVVVPHVFQAGKLKPGGEVEALRTLVGLTGADGHAENVGLAILCLVKLACCVLCFVPERLCYGLREKVSGERDRLEKDVFLHLCACVFDGLVEIQELFLVLLVGELEHGDSVDAFGHFDGS